MLASSPNQGIAPTMLASSPNQGIPASEPTFPPASNPYTPYPQANYGESAPPPPPYSAPSQSPYNAPPPPYSAPQQSPYGAPPPLYGIPPSYAQQQPKSNRGCITAVVIVLVVLVVIVGGSIAAFSYAVHTASNNLSTAVASLPTAVPTIDTSSTATPVVNNGGVPDASQVDANAAAMILTAQSSSGIDSNYQPIDSKTAFNTGDKVYITFKTAGKDGYIQAKWFVNGQHDHDSSPLQDSGGNTDGYFANNTLPSGNVVVGLYWCTQADCSDAALAQVVAFTVS